MNICIQREVISTTSPSLRDWSNNKFSYIYPTLLATYIQYNYLLQYNLLIKIQLIRVHMVFSVFSDHVVKKECRQFLLNSSHTICW